MTRLQTNLLHFLLLYSLTAFGQSKSKDYLLPFIDKTKNKCGYINQNGDTVIRADNYRFCFTDTFKTYAIVLDSNSHFVGIDRRQNILYTVFPFDNGPDYAVDGLFRIIINNKIGYADDLSGKVIIKPQFDCADPFENGIAGVGMDCTKYFNDPEHWTWTSKNWFYIDKKGRKIKPPSSKK